MEHITTITPKEAIGNGDLGGFTISCSCGDKATSSMVTLAQKYAIDHVAYMENKESKSPKCEKNVGGSPCGEPANNTYEFGSDVFHLCSLHANLYDQLTTGRIGFKQYYSGRGGR
jgi:hypothetical protein